MSAPFSTVPTSRRKTVGPAPTRSGSDARSWMAVTTELIGVMRVRLPIRTLPAGRMVFPEAMARTTSSGDMR
jgi:hypothetical protein